MPRHDVFGFGEWGWNKGWSGRRRTDRRGTPAPTSALSLWPWRTGSSLLSDSQLISREGAGASSGPRCLRATHLWTGPSPLGLRLFLLREMPATKQVVLIWLRLGKPVWSPLYINQSSQRTEYYHVFSFKGWQIIIKIHLENVYYVRENTATRKV